VRFGPGSGQKLSAGMNLGFKSEEKGLIRSFPQPDRRHGAGGLAAGFRPGWRLRHRLGDATVGSALDGFRLPPGQSSAGFEGRSRTLCFLLAQRAPGTDTGLPALTG